jgi:hypothetical protein
MELPDGTVVSVGQMLRKAYRGRRMKPLLETLSAFFTRRDIFAPRLDLFALPKDFKIESRLLDIVNKLKEYWPDGFAPVYKKDPFPFCKVAQEVNRGKNPYPIWQNQDSLTIARVMCAMFNEMARSSNGMLKGFHYVLDKPDGSIQFIPMNLMIDGKTEFAKIVGNCKLYIYPADVKATGYELSKYKFDACKIDLNMSAFVYAICKGIDIPLFEKRSYSSGKNVEFDKIPCKRCGSGQELNGILTEPELLKIMLEFCPLREIPMVLDNELIPVCNKCCRDMVIETSPKQFNPRPIDYGRDFQPVAEKLSKALESFPRAALAEVIDSLYFRQAFHYVIMGQIRQQECRRQNMESMCRICRGPCGYYYSESKLPEVRVRMDVSCAKLIINTGKMVACGTGGINITSLGDGATIAGVFGGESARQIANCEAKLERFNKALTASTASTEALIVAPMVATATDN